MASFRITPVKQMIRDENGQLAQVPVLGAPLTAVVIATAAATSSAVNVEVAMVYSEADAYFNNDGATVTSSNGHFLAAGERMFVGHKPGNTFSIKNTS